MKEIEFWVPPLTEAMGDTTATTIIMVIITDKQTIRRLSGWKNISGKGYKSSNNQLNLEQH
jgi:hypothetical protein